MRAALAQLQEPPGCGWIDAALVHHMVTTRNGVNALSERQSKEMLRVADVQDGKVALETLVDAFFSSSGPKRVAQVRLDGCS